MVFSTKGVFVILMDDKQRFFKFPDLSGISDKKVNEKILYANYAHSVFTGRQSKQIEHGPGKAPDTNDF